MSKMLCPHCGCELKLASVSPKGKHFECPNPDCPIIEVRVRRYDEKVIYSSVM